MSACRKVGCSQGAGPHETHDDLLLSGGWDGLNGLPDPAAPAAAAEQLDDLRAQVRSAYLDVLSHRDRAARDVTAQGRARAVAYQTCASRLLCILDTQRGAS